jgi:membrane protease YdiL (CAAX protease family)
MMEDTMKLAVTPSSFSKLTLIGMLTVTFGAELLLYFSRYSYFMDQLYTYILLFSLFLAFPLHQVFKRQDATSSFRRLVFQYSYVFLIYFTFATALDLVSSNFLHDFTTAYEENTVQHLEYAPSYTEGESEDYITVHPFWENLDYYGSSFLLDTFAGLEEVSRLSYILLVLLLCSVMFRRRAQEGKMFPFYVISLFFSSLMFGVGHILSQQYTFTENLGSVLYYTHAGLILGILLLWTRNLWILIFVHASYNFSISLSLYLWEYSHFIYFSFIFILFIVLAVITNNERQIPKEQESVELKL